MTNKSKIILIILFLIAIISCINKPRNRDRLIFIDKVDHVRDSLSKIEGLLSMLPKRNDIKNINYKFSDHRFSINDTSMNDIRDSVFSNIYTINQKAELLKLSRYLGDNFVSGGYFDEVYGIWRFQYRDFPESRFNDVRDLCVFDSGNVSLEKDTILDQKDGIFLLAPKEAKIN